MPKINNITKKNTLYEWLDILNNTIDESNISITDISIENDKLTFTRVNDTITNITIPNTGVTSINGERGDVILDEYVTSITISNNVLTFYKKDGTSNSISTYTLPAATNSTLGGVKIGSNITNSSGTISLTKNNVVSALGYTPPQKDTTYNVFTGATSTQNGTTGLVPQPAKGKQNKPLRGDGTWADYLDCYAKGIYTSDTDKMTFEELKNSISGYLPLTGGTMTGTITQNQGSAKPVLRNSTGGEVWLFPSTDSTYLGGFILRSKESNGTTHDLLGRYNGQLTWNGKNIVRSINGINADTNGNINININSLSSSTVFIANQSAQIYLPAGGTWRVLYMNWGSDWGIPSVVNLAGGSAVPMAYDRTVVFAVKIA